MGNFEFDGEKYKQASKHQKEWGNKLIAGLKLTGNETILDLGCGDGVLTEQLARSVPDGRVLGIDASVGMIETARKLRCNNLTFACADINEINFNAEFDVIYSNAALHWVKDHERLLKNCYAALKTSGVIQWNFAAAGTCETFNAAAQSAIREDAFKAYFTDFVWPWFMPSKEQYEALAAETDFRSFSVDYENADRYFADRAEMIKWIDQPSLVPFLVRLPDEKKEGFRKRVIDGILAKAEQPDGKCFEYFRRLHVNAIK